MNPRIKLIPRAQFECLSATATRDELLEILSTYVIRRPGRVATGKATPAAERMRAYRKRNKAA